MRRDFTKARFDWLLVIAYIALVIFGEMNIYSALRVEDSPIWDLSQKYGMHLVWIGVSVITALLIMYLISSNLWSVLAWWGYGIMIVMLLATIIFGAEHKGSQSWLEIGPIRLQPAEFSKITTSLALASIMGKYGYRFNSTSGALSAIFTIALPMLLILLENETGSMLVYLAFVLVFYIEGLSGWFINMGIFAVMIFIFTLMLSPLKVIVISASILTLLCVIYNKLPWWSVIILAISDAAALLLPKLLAIEPIAALNPLSAEMWVVILTVALAIFALIKILFFNRRRVKFLRNTLLVYICSVVLIFSVNFIFKNVLQDHQRGRIEVLLGLKEDIRGAGYNVHQSMIAIGSGGLTGKGYMNGTQTRFGFVPEQETDFIFCTIGEEWGFMGTVITLAIYLFIVCRVLISAGKNSFAFTRIYGYCFACCLLMHVFINVCMTIGLMPVIGIPLPFLSYGGSSILAFTIFLFIFIRLDSEQKTSY